MEFIFLSEYYIMDPGYIKLKEIKPALTGYIRESQIKFRRESVPDEKVIHDVRVLMKKSRAVLKLVIPQLDIEYTNRDLVALREVGRRMCAWRETSVLRRNLKDLKKEFPDIFIRLAENDKINLNLRKPDTVAAPPALIEEAEEINELLRKTSFRIRFVTMSKLDPQMLLRELEQTYTRVVDKYLDCRNNPHPAKLHEFRKKAKDFLYQLYFFRPLNPSAIKTLEKRLDNLTQNLGRFNDLTQLVMALEYEYAPDKNEPAMDELVIRIRDQQDRYLSKIWPAAYRIFCPGQKLANVLGFKLLLI